MAFNLIFLCVTAESESNY